MVSSKISALSCSERHVSLPFTCSEWLERTYGKGAAMENFDINFRIEKSRKKLNADVFRKQPQELLPGLTGAGVQVASAAIVFTIFNFFFSIMFEESTKIDVGFSLLHSKCS